MRSRPNFDGIAPYYDFLAQLVFGNQLEVAQKHFIKKLNNPSSLLVFGGGTGRILTPILENHPDAHIYYVESSTKMLSMAKARYSPDTYSIDYIRSHADPIIATNLQYDVVITPFVLDVFESAQLLKVVQVLFESLQPGGLWIHTDFYTNNGGPWWRFLLIKVMYRFFRITTGMKNLTLPDFDTIFNKMMLEQLGAKSFCNQLVKTTIYQKYQEKEPSH